MKRFFDLGVRELNGHLLYALAAEEYAAAEAWLERHGILDAAAEAAADLAGLGAGPGASVDALFDKVESRFVDAWVGEANLTTYGEAVADALAFRESEGDAAGDERRGVAPLRRRAPRCGRAGEKARALGVDVAWDCELAQDAGGLLPGPRRRPLRHRQVARRGAVRRPAVDGDQDRRPRRGARVRRGRSTPSSPTRCSPTTSRRRSTGTPPA